MKMYILLLVAAFSFSCSNDARVILNGLIGEGLESRFELQESKHEVNGVFYYLDKPYEKIQVKGTKVGSDLRIDEYNEKGGKITGTFFGSYLDGQYTGVWVDPKQENKVNFTYTSISDSSSESAGIIEQTSASSASLSNPAEDATEDSTMDQPLVNQKVNYSVLGQLDYNDVEKVQAEIGGKKYTISGLEDAYNITIVKVARFDNDEYEDALISTNCGGTACPTSQLCFLSYDTENDHFRVSDLFGDIIEPPTYEKKGSSMNVEITSHSASGRWRIDEEYILSEGEIDRIYFKEYREVHAIAELQATEFSDNEMALGEGKELFYDLDSDGVIDTIHGEYWARWEILNWEVRFGNGKFADGPSGCYRVGVLEDRTNGVNNLVAGLDDVLTWNGQEFIQK